MRIPAKTGPATAMIFVPSPAHFAPASRAASACSLERCCFSRAFWIALSETSVNWCWMAGGAIHTEHVQFLACICHQDVGSPIPVPIAGADGLPARHAVGPDLVGVGGIAGFGFIGAFSWKLAVRPGFEPGQRPPKGLVLPLHHRTGP